MSHAAPAVSATAPTPTADSPRKLVAIVLGLVTVLTLMLLAFAAPALGSGPSGLPLAVSGPPQATSQVVAALDQQAPGTFDVTMHATADEAKQAILDREAIGGISVGPRGVTIQTAAGAGAAYTQLLTGIGSGLEESGQQVTHEELAPTTTDDPSTIGVATLGMPLVFGGMATAAILLLVFKGSFGSRLLGAGSIAVLGGLVAAAVLQLGFGAFDASYWQVALAIAFGIFAISSTVLGLGTLLGTPGIGLGAVTMLFVANPLSGLANGPQWLPSPWGEVGQYLPIGAAGSLIRSVAFFDGGGGTHPALVLGAWVLAGVALGLIGVARSPRTAGDA